MRNVHIYPSEFRHESRILKEAATLSETLGFSRVDLVGVTGQGVPRQEQVAPAITIHRLGPSKGRGVMKAVRHAVWCLNVLWFCLTRRYGVVNCHSLAVLPIGALVRLLSGAKLVYDTHELETETAGSSPRRRSVGRVVERAFVRFASLVIVVSPGIERWYRQQYALDAIITVLNAPNYQEARTSRHDLTGAGATKTVVLYQGALAPGRGIERLVEASTLLDQAGYVLVLMGYGSLETVLREQAKDLPFVVHPAVSPTTLLEYTAAADIGVCLIEDVCLSYNLSLPNKLFEYAMARLPVVASNLPEIRSVVVGHQIGVCLEAWEPIAILDAVRQADAMRGEALSRRVREVAKVFCWEQQEIVLRDGYQKHVLVG